MESRAAPPPAGCLPTPPPHHAPSPPPFARAAAPRRLKDVEHADGRLYLVFEWVDKDLKKYMDSIPGGMSMPLVKVRRPASRPAPPPGGG